MKTAFFSESTEKYAGILLSLITGAVWFLICSFDKSLYIYHDEVTYAEAARDIYNGISPMLQHLRPSYFSKVFYSYLIAPGFAFSDPTLWQTFLNAVFSGLTVLFTWLCSRLLIESWKLRIAGVFLTALLPVYSYAVYATPDCLFFCETALSMLVFTAMCRCILDGARMSTAVLLAVLLGMVNFISYFTKEVAAAFIISEAAALIAAPLIAGGKRKEFFQALAVFLLMFFLLCLYLKFVLIPQDVGNSYQNQVYPLRIFLERAEPGRLAYKFFFMVTGACFSVYLIPLLAPMFEFRGLQPAARILCLAVFCSFALLTLAVIYTISWTEDYTVEYPHWQFRYHVAYFPVLVTLAVLAFEKRILHGGKLWQRSAVLVMFCIAMSAFYPMPVKKASVSVYENPTINLFRHSMYLEGTGFSQAACQKISLVLLLISVSVLSLPFVVPGTGKKLKAAGIASLAAASVLLPVTGYFYAALNRIDSGISPELKSDAIELASFLDRLAPGKIVLFTEKARTKETSAFYTYARNPSVSVPVKALVRDSAGSGSFDFTVPHHIGAGEHGYNGRLLYPEAVIPSPDVIVKPGNAFVKFPGKEAAFISRNRHYAVIFNSREPYLPVKEENQEE